MCILRLPFCLGYFSHFLIEMHNRMPLQEGKVYFDSKIIAGIAWHMRYETVIASKARKQSHECWCTVCFILFTRCETPACGMVLPTLGVGLPSLLITSLSLLY